MPATASAREIIHIQVGKSGCALGHEFWRDLCEEHKIEHESEIDKGKWVGDDQKYEERLNVFFNQGSKDNYVPRCILVDLNMQDMQVITQDGLGSLYRPENVIGNDEGSGNCYAKAFHTEGPDLADRVLENVRKEVERCECLQGVQFTHSISGGTGSGLTGLLLKTLYDYLDKGSKCILQSFTLVPAPGISDVIIEPYNSALALQDLLEYCHQVFIFDNCALREICMKTEGKDTPRFEDMNNIVAKCMSGITCCLRFTGPLNSNLHKLQTNLVPFKNAHFLITGFAPLTAGASKKYRKVTVLDLAQQMISKDNVTVKCDPLNPGDDREGILKARFLASNASWRGPATTYEVDNQMWAFQKTNSRFDKFFPDWIPCSISSNICSVPHGEDTTASVTFVSNNTAVHEVFDRIIQNWDNMYKPKSYLHIFEQDGISTQDMMESRNIVQYISDEYCEFARWEDKFFEEGGQTEPTTGRKKIKESAVENDEQRKICEELQMLDEGDMYISAVAR